MSSPPEVALWLTVPKDCLMRGEFEAGDLELPNIQFILGSTRDDQNLLFEREALERFVGLAQRMLAIPVSPHEPIPRLALESSSGLEIQQHPPRWAVA